MSDTPIGETENVSTPADTSANAVRTKQTNTVDAQREIAFFPGTMESKPIDSK